MKAGTLRHRVTIQRPEVIQDSNGDTETSWTDVAEVWAAVEPVSAREFVQAQAEQSKITARVVIRHRTDVDATCRILHRDQVLNIEGVLADKASGLEYLTLPVSAGVRGDEI